MAPKPEFPPLLSLGFHPMTLGDVRSLCVGAFPLSRTRDRIMVGLELVARKLHSGGIKGQIWVNGSFLTEKIDPADSDVLLCLKDSFCQSATESQLRRIEWMQSVKKRHLCDGYLLIEYPEGHHLYPLTEWNRAYWIRQFGFTRGNEVKGIAVIDLFGRTI